jgi:hypothetical protein
MNANDTQLVEHLDTLGFVAIPHKRTWWISRKAAEQGGRKHSGGFYFEPHTLRQHRRAGTLLEYVHDHLEAMANKVGEDVA